MRFTEVVCLTCWWSKQTELDLALDTALPHWHHPSSYVCLWWHPDWGSLEKNHIAPAWSSTQHWALGTMAGGLGSGPQLSLWVVLDKSLDFPTCPYLLTGLGWHSNKLSRKISGKWKCHGDSRKGGENIRIRLTLFFDLSTCPCSDVNFLEVCYLFAAFLLLKRVGLYFSTSAQPRADNKLDKGATWAPRRFGANHIPK